MVKLLLICSGIYLLFAVLGTRGVVMLLVVAGGLLWFVASRSPLFDDPPAEPYMGNPPSAELCKELDKDEKNGSLPQIEIDIMASGCPGRPIWKPPPSSAMAHPAR